MQISAARTAAVGSLISITGGRGMIAALPGRRSGLAGAAGRGTPGVVRYALACIAIKITTESTENNFFSVASVSPW